MLPVFDKYLMKLILLVLAFACSAGSVFGQDVYYNSFNDYEVYTSMSRSSGFKPRIKRESIFKPTPATSINSDGLVGFFVGNTAELVDRGEMVLSSRFKYNVLSSAYGRAYNSAEEGSVSSFETSLTWIGDWAEWSVTVPLHKWDLSAPRTYGGHANSNNGMGNMKLGWKASYLRDHSYYRGAYGVVAVFPTGNPDSMLPAGVKKGEEFKLFGCLTTSETDRAKANIEMGYIINNKDDDENRFIYNFGLSYEATEHVSLISEISGEVQGGDDKDTMDLILGARFGATEKIKIELAWYRNLRTYRAYGWDDRLQAGFSMWW